MRKFVITTPTKLLVVLIVVVVVVATLVVTSASASTSASSTASRGVAAIATSSSSTSTSSISATAAATAVHDNDNNELMLLWAKKLLSRSSIRCDNDSNAVDDDDGEEQQGQEEEAQLLRVLQITEDKDENENEDKDMYVNFLELLEHENSDSSTITSIIDQLKEYINGDGSAVNNLINQFLLPTANSSSVNEDANDDANSSATISFNIPNGFLLDLGIGGSSVNLTSVTVGGINTFTLVNLLQPVTVSIDNNDNDNDNDTLTNISTYEYESPNTIIQNNFKMKELYLDLNLIETITTTSGSTTESVVSMRLPFQNITMIALPIRLALFIEAIKQMPMGAILDYENYLMICLQQIIHELEIIEMDIEFGLVEYPIMLLNETMSSPFFDAITSLFIGLPIAVPIFFNTTIRNIINDLLYDNILDIDNDNDDSSNAVTTCPSYPTIVEVNDSYDDESTNNLLIDYRKFFNEGLPLMIKDLIDSQLIANDSSTGLPKINNVVIEPFIGENMTFNGNSESNDNSNYLLDTNGNIQLGGLDADYKFSIEYIQIQNINTMIQPLEILSIIENQPYQLNNTITMGLPLDEKPMSVSVNKLYFAILTDEDGSIENEINIKMDMEAINVILTMIMKIVESKLYGFHMENIMNIHCWLDIIQTPTLDDDQYGIRIEHENITLGLSNLVASIKKMNLNITCTTCSSPGMVELSELLDTNNAQDSVTKTMNAILNSITSLFVPSYDNNKKNDNNNDKNNNIGDGLGQIQIDRWLNEAACEYTYGDQTRIGQNRTTFHFLFPCCILFVYVPSVRIAKYNLFTDILIGLSSRGKPIVMVLFN